MKKAHNYTTNSPSSLSTSSSSTLDSIALSSSSSSLWVGGLDSFKGTRTSEITLSTVSDSTRGHNESKWRYNTPKEKKSTEREGRYTVWKDETPRNEMERTVGRKLLAQILHVQSYLRSNFFVRVLDGSDERRTVVWFGVWRKLRLFREDSKGFADIFMWHCRVFPSCSLQSYLPNER